MDISSPPLIRVSHHRPHHRCQSPSRRSPSYPSFSTAAAPMPIPSAVRDPSPPPPLPPPRNIEELGLAHEPGWPWSTNPNWTGFGRPSVRPGSSLLGGKNSPTLEEESEEDLQHIDPARRGSSISTVTPAQRGRDATMEGSNTSSDEEENSASSNYRLHSERQLEQRSLDNSSHAYDRNLLSKIGGPNTPGRGSLSFASPGSAEAAAASPGLFEGRRSSLKPLSVPQRRQSSFDASAAGSRWTSLPPTSDGASPGSFRSPAYDPEFSRPAAHRQPSLTLSDTASHKSSYDANMFTTDEFPMEDGPMKNLDLNDRSPSSLDEIARAGTKRRASSPHRESTREERSSIGSAAGSRDLYHMRSVQQLPQRTSPIPKYQHPNHGSVSSASSYGPRGSLSSSYGLSIASSVTSLASGRLSPNPLSPLIDPELASLYGGSKSLNPSPRGSLSVVERQRTLSESAQGTAKMNSETEVLPHQGNIGFQGLLICDCCPKKPRKFATEEDLRQHHSEKQYTCAYCPNRFKNKNEAERHQNSLHLRRHSWSCSALQLAQSAFHSNQTNGGATDICGFCGEEFSNPPNWEHRRDHVSHTHKFGECNQAKKFFRADHFRQHLKHSHSGTSGKWTNMLETACMKDEPLPQPMKDRGPPGNTGLAQMPPGPAPLATMTNISMTGMSVGKPAVIDEVPYES